jgi:annexin A7/11
MTVGKDLIKVIEKEVSQSRRKHRAYSLTSLLQTSGYFEYALRLKALGPVGGDVWLLHRACDGLGTHEDLLNELLLLRTNNDIYILKQAYRAVYGKDLVQVVDGELSMVRVLSAATRSRSSRASHTQKTKRLFTMALGGARQEDAAPVDSAQVSADVKALKSAARGAGTDEIAICSILVSRSTPHLQAIARAYGSNGLSKMVESEFSGHMKDALLYIANGVEKDGWGVERDARLIEASMAGMGTKDERLAYRLVSRCFCCHTARA